MFILWDRSCVRISAVNFSETHWYCCVSGHYWSRTRTVQITTAGRKWSCWTVNSFRSVLNQAVVQLSQLRADSSVFSYQVCSDWNTDTDFLL